MGQTDQQLDNNLKIISHRFTGSNFSFCMEKNHLQNTHGYSEISCTHDIRQLSLSVISSLWTANMNSLNVSNKWLCGLIQQIPRNMIRKLMFGVGIKIRAYCALTVHSHVANMISWHQDSCIKLYIPVYLSQHSMQDRWRRFYMDCCT